MPTLHDARYRSGFIALEVASILEALSLTVILVNRFTAHIPAVTSSGGPVHGVLYISTIALALILPLPRRAKWLAVIPGIGGLLAVTTLRVSGRAPVRKNGAPDSDDHSPHSDGAGAVHLPPKGPLVASFAGVMKRMSADLVLGPLTFSVPEGRITGLIGPNGAGKTTSLRMLINLFSLDAGTVTILGRSNEHVADVLPQVGALIEGPTFFDSLSARENLLVLSRLSGWPDSTADDALDRVGLSDRQREKVGTFSLGMRQRLGLGAALLNSPTLLILDEPTNGLDPQGSEELRFFLLELVSQGTSIIISSHLLSDIEEICDHLVVLAAGRGAVFEGPPDAMTALNTPSVICSTATADDATRLRDVLSDHGFSLAESRNATEVFVPTSGADSGRLNHLAAAAGIVLTGLHIEQPTLQDAFFELTGQPDRGSAGMKTLATGRSR